MSAQECSNRTGRVLIEMVDARVVTACGRVLFDGMNLRLGRDRVAVTGRNGVGKSTSLALLAGDLEPQQGQIRYATKPYLVPQSCASEELDHQSLIRQLRTVLRGRHPLAVECIQAGLRSVGEPECATRLSNGELRKLLLIGAKASCAEVLLLDEPSEDLDDQGVAWLVSWTSEWRGGLVVVSHDRRLLECFQHFFFVKESGGRLFSGRFAEFERVMGESHRTKDQRYARCLHRLAEAEERSLHLARRKARKKRYGRCSELDRATPRVRLNQKRDYAQKSHGRVAQVREARLTVLREWSQAMRRALHVDLSLNLAVPVPPMTSTEPPVVSRDLSVTVDGRYLFEGLNLTLQRERVGVIGPNGAGKTTLLESLLGRRIPTTGSVRCDLARIGYVAQDAVDWCRDDSLLAILCAMRGIGRDSPNEVASLLANFKFPIGLAARPLASLSPGERGRAALICLFARTPIIELLVLDEPTFSLDLAGRCSLVKTLCRWQARACGGQSRSVFSFGNRHRPIHRTQARLIKSELQGVG